MTLYTFLIIICVRSVHHRFSKITHKVHLVYFQHLEGKKTEQKVLLRVGTEHTGTTKYDMLGIQCVKLCSCLDASYIQCITSEACREPHLIRPCEGESHLVIDKAMGYLQHSKNILGMDQTYYRAHSLHRRHRKMMLLPAPVFCQVLIIWLPVVYKLTQQALLEVELQLIDCKGHELGRWLVAMAPLRLDTFHIVPSKMGTAMT